MVKRYLSTKFYINLLDACDGFEKKINWYYGLDGQTDDGRPRGDSSSAV